MSATLASSTHCVAPNRDLSKFLAGWNEVEFGQTKGWGLAQGVASYDS